MGYTGPLADKDRIFTNVYGFQDAGLKAARARGDHLTTAEALKCRARIERERGALQASIATLRIGIFEAEGVEEAGHARHRTGSG